MYYSPITPEKRSLMLKAIGVDSIEALFDDIPKNAENDIQLATSLTEFELKNTFNTLAKHNVSSSTMLSFMGGGAYTHFIPSAIKYLVNRSEFTTSYTPYQPEISQGTLRAIFEFQTMVTQLTGLAISNASVYDGATALAESGVVAFHAKQKTKPNILVPTTLSPSYKDVLLTYWAPKGITLVEVGSQDTPYAIPESAWEAQLNDSTLAVVLPYPDFFGTIHDYSSLIAKAKAAGAYVIMHCDPLALSLLKSPGELGADLASAEGQPLGIPVAFGGPYLGIMTASTEFIRLLPGRIAGETVDQQGKTGYVLTLQTREQHIRREKAFSSICTNQGLLALTATIYMSLMGPNGMKLAAQTCMAHSRYLTQELKKIGLEVLNTGTTFKECVVKLPKPAKAIVSELKKHNILAGVDLSKLYPNLTHHLLIATTEIQTKAQMDQLVSALKGVL